MDHKTLVTQVANKIGREPADVATLIEGLTMILKERCGQTDAIAIPGFGNFVGKKVDEKIVNDLSSGQRVLLPPSITIEFEPSGVLKNTIARLSR